MKLLQASSCLLAAALLAGCASTPRQCNSYNANASLLEKASCDFSGGYSEQVRQQEQELAQARAENEHFRQVYQQIAEQQAATSLSLQEQQRKQADLNRSLRGLLSQLQARHASKAEVQQQIIQLQQQMHNLEQSPASSPAAVATRQQELRDLQRQVSRLQLSLGYE